jgi:U2 small nuclear ribonucleoprotein A'
LGKRGIDTLINFQSFKNLEVLWLNNNNLVKIDGLDANFRIKELYLHNNNLRTLDGSLKNMKHLNVLTLYNNELSNLDQNIDFLSDFVYLEHLELWGNPLSEEPNYRISVIHALRTLKLFERHNVSDLERISADKFIKDNKIVGIKKPRKKAFKVFEQISDSKPKRFQIFLS